MEWGKNIQSIPGFYIGDQTLKVIQDFLFSGYHVLLTGNPGCGKTDFGQAWAKAYGLDYHKVNCGAIRSPREWFGRWEFKEGQGTVFIPSKFVEMLEKPCLIILDEINRTTPDNHNPLMNILDGNREVYVDEMNRFVRVHERTVFVATANRGSRHTGTYNLDEAMEDRFQEIRLELPPNDVIAELLQLRYPISREQAQSIAAVAVKLNEMYDEDLLSKSMGMRPALAAAALICRGNSLLDAIRFAFVHHYPSSTFESEQSIAVAAIQGLVSDYAKV
jgi:nitric oxide reductase NorQ protein